MELGVWGGDPPLPPILSRIQRNAELEEERLRRLREHMELRSFIRDCSEVGGTPKHGYKGGDPQNTSVTGGRSPKCSYRGEGTPQIRLGSIGKPPKYTHR